MAITLGKNLTALSVTRSLDRATQEVNRTYERLSSGLRINRASDDAAGLSVSTSLSNRTRVLGRGLLNISDAISVINIADSALEQVNGLLTRMSELASQAANGSYSLTQRKTMEAEYLALDQEIRRIGKSTSFNGINLLSGTPSARDYSTIDIGGVAGGTTIGSASADGRYVTAFDDINSNILLIDTQTGSKQIVATGLDSSTAKVATTLANGDVVYGESSGDIFYWSKDTGSARNLTSGSAGSVVSEGNIAVSADGSTIAFVSGQNLVEGGTINDRQSTAYGGYQLWTLNINSGVLRRIPQSFGAVSTSATFSLSSNGSYISGTDGINNHFVANTSGTSITTRYLTALNLTSFGVSNSGVAYFRSTSNPTGGNGNAIAQLFSVDYSTGVYKQLTNFTAATNIAATRFSTDGSTIYLRSTSDLSGEGRASGTSQLFAFNTANPGFERLTNYSASISGVISGDGGRVLGVDGSGNIRVFDTTGADQNLDFEVGAGATGNIVGALSAYSNAVRGLGAYGLTSQLQARAALDRIQANITNVSQARGNIGVIMSRLTIAGRLVQSQRDEIQAADNRIKDVDIASEAASLVRNSIVQQVGAALLAQARLAPRLALTLLNT